MHVLPFALLLLDKDAAESHFTHRHLPRNAYRARGGYRPLQRAGL